MRAIKILAGITGSLTAVLFLKKQREMQVANVAVAPRLPAKICIVASEQMTSEQKVHLETRWTLRLNRPVLISEHHYAYSTKEKVLHDLTEAMPKVIVLVIRSDDCEEACQMRNMIAVHPELLGVRIVDLYNDSPLKPSTIDLNHNENQVQIELCERREIVPLKS